ncbi:MAG: hypothetical protein COA50_15550 [Flavobacteriaceae bacterium]|nr:MAG: hypothetical protein COA50_15550 [Flavobacteriaceae bacterium]
MVENRKNPFQELEKSLKEAPPEMKKKVMRDIAIVKLVMDMTFLVTANYSSILNGLFKTKQRN